MEEKVSTRVSRRQAEGLRHGREVRRRIREGDGALRGVGEFESSCASISGAFSTWSRAGGGAERWRCGSIGEKTVKRTREKAQLISELEVDGLFAPAARQICEVLNSGCLNES